MSRDFVGQEFGQVTQRCWAALEGQSGSTHMSSVFVRTDGKLGSEGVLNSIFCGMPVSYKVTCDSKNEGSDDPGQNSKASYEPTFEITSVKMI